MTDWNAEHRFQGRKDIPLNDTGRQQALRNGEALKAFMPEISEFDFVSSPLGRTRNTMEIIRKSLGLDPKQYAVDERLVEAAYGEFEGTRLEEIENSKPEIFALRKQDRWNFQPPGGESLAMTLERVRPFFDALTRPTVIVAHGAVGRTVRMHLLGLSQHDAAWYVFPQDKVLLFEGGKEQLI